MSNRWSRCVIIICVVRTAILILIFASLVVNALSQTGVAYHFEIASVIRNQDQEVIPGLKLVFNRGGQIVEAQTDINGEFKALLFHGEHVLTARSIPDNEFKVFIHLRQNALNPSFIELRVNTPKVLGTRPKIVTSPMPRYPPALSAVRAQGEVVVSLKIDVDGTVKSANVLSGHPLLRGETAEVIRTWIFEKAQIEREVKITVNYLSSDGEKPGLKRYVDPYRPVIVASPQKELQVP